MSRNQWLHRSLVALALISASTNVIAQNIDRVYTATGGQWDVNQPFIARYGNGNLLMITRGGESIDLDGPNVTGSGGELAEVTFDTQFFVQYADDGSINWTRRLSSQAGIVVKDLFVDEALNAYLVGSAFVDVDLDGPNVSGQGGEMTIAGNTIDDSNGFFAKYNNSGDLIWARQLGGMGDDNVTSGTVDADGNVVLVGSFKGTADFDGPGASGPGSQITTPSRFSGSYMAKYDANGDFLWVRQIEGDTESLNGYKSVDTDAGGNIYACAQFWGTADLDGSSVTGAGGEFTDSQLNDLLLAKFDPAGTLLWAKESTGDDHEVCERLLLDYEDNIVIGGYYIGNGDFDGPRGSGLGGETVSNGEEDLYVARYNSEGDLDWVRSVGTSESEFTRFRRSASIALDAGGNVYLGGTTEGSVDFDGPGVTGAGGESDPFDDRDAIIIKYSWEGDFLWTIRHEDENEGLVVGLQVDTDNSLYAVGEYKGDVDMDGLAISGFGGEVSNPTKRWLVAAVRYTQDPVETSTESAGVSADFVLDTLYPNPTNDAATVRYRTSGHTSVRLRIFDVLGRTAIDIAKGVVSEGQHEESIDVRDLPSGVYVLLIESRGGVLSSEFVVTR